MKRGNDDATVCVHSCIQLAFCGMMKCWADSSMLRGKVVTKFNYCMWGCFFMIKPCTEINVGLHSDRWISYDSSAGIAIKNE